MTELDKLQGTWDVTSLEMYGDPMPVPPGARIVVQDKRFRSLGMGATYEGRIELGERARSKMKTIDMVFTNGPEKGNKSLGIYELDGDEWKLCLTVTGSKRPAAFTTGPDDGCALEILKRGMARDGDADEEDASEQATEALPAPSGASDPAPEMEGEWQMVACTSDGYPVPESMVQTGTRIARHGVTESFFGKKRLIKAAYSVNKQVIPHTIDYSLGRDSSQYGIWRFEGEVLHICFAPAGKLRPVDFDARKGQGHTFTAWRKIAG